jgi:hypothetical protein
MGFSLLLLLNQAQVMLVPCLSGNVDLVNRLLLDAGITSDLVKQWRDQMP